MRTINEPTAESLTASGDDRIKREDYPGALADYNRAIERDGGYAPAYAGRGMAYMFLNEEDKALADFAQAIALEPDESGHYFTRGIFLATVVNRYEEGIKDFSQVIRRIPRYPDVWYQRGIAYLALRNYRRAIGDLTWYIGMAPDDPNGYLKRAACYTATGDLEAASADDARAIARGGDPAAGYTVHTYINRAKVAVANKDYPAALAECNRAIALDGGDINVAYMYRGGVYARMGDWEKTLADCNWCLDDVNKRFPDFLDKNVAIMREALFVVLSDAWYGWGTTLYKAGNRNEARRAFKKAARYNPSAKNPKTALLALRCNMGLDLRGKGQVVDFKLPEKAESSGAAMVGPDSAPPGERPARPALVFPGVADPDASPVEAAPTILQFPEPRAPVSAEAAAPLHADWHTALRQFPPNTSYYEEQGNDAMEEEDYDRAREFFTKAITIEGERPELYFYRAGTYCFQSDYPPCIADLTQAIRLEPDMMVYYRCRGGVYNCNGEYMKAITDLSRVLDQDPTDMSAFHQRGICYAKMGEFRKAVADLSRSAALQPDHLLTQYYLAQSHEDAGDDAAAIAGYTRVLALDKDHEGAWLNRAGCRFREHDYPGAVADYDQVLRLNPDQEDAWNGRACARAAAGDDGGAIADWEAALALDADDPGVLTRLEAAREKRGA